MTTALILVIAIAVLAIFWLIFSYNRFIHLNAMLKEGWSGIDVQLKRRYDLIPNLVSTVKGYSIHEKNIIEDIVRMRAASMGTSDIKEKAAAEQGLTQSLKTLFALAEQYPNLKANENFLALQNELGSLEQELQLARRYYNGTARNYNIAISTFPSNIIAGTFGFVTTPYFEVTSSDERDVPKTNF
jgi:LemA protein